MGSQCRAFTVVTPLTSLTMMDKKLFSWTNKYQKLNNEILLNNVNQKKFNESKPNTNINFIKNIKNVNQNKVIEARTLSASWFCPKMSRFQTENFLKNSPVGSFVVRNCSSQNCSYVLSLRAPGVTVQHYLILSSATEVKISGSVKSFSSLFSLVTHLSIMKEILPCRLSLSSTDSEAESSDGEEQEDIIDLDCQPELEEIVSQLKKFLSVQ